MNPFNNSQCVMCKRDMSDVDPILTVPSQDELPPAGYQPTIEPEEMAFYMGLIGFTAAVEFSFNVQSQRPGEKQMTLARKLLHGMTEHVLRDRLGRTPTNDEINFIISVTEPGRFGEVITRFSRLMKESTGKADPATLAEIEKIRMTLTEALDAADRNNE